MYMIAEISKMPLDQYFLSLLESDVLSHDQNRTAKWNTTERRKRYFFVRLALFSVIREVVPRQLD